MNTRRHTLCLSTVESHHVTAQHIIVRSTTGLTLLHAAAAAAHTASLQSVLVTLSQ